MPPLVLLFILPAKIVEDLALTAKRFPDTVCADSQERRAMNVQITARKLDGSGCKLMLVSPAHAEEELKKLARNHWTAKATRDDTGAHVGGVEYDGTRQRRDGRWLWWMDPEAVR